LEVVGGVVILFHLAALVVAVLAAPSGPWPGPMGSMPSFPPQFAIDLDRVTAFYRQALKLTHNYHFRTNRPVAAVAQFEIRLLDEAGQQIGAQRYPDNNANPWVRHRQALLAHWLTDDEPVAPPMGESIPAPTRAMPMTMVWEPDGTRKLRLQTIPEHLVARDRPVERPSTWQMLVVRSYARHACRTSGAASAQIVRYSRFPVPPAAVFTPNVPASNFDELVSDYGVMEK
jgi:hypothetical protein